VSAEDQKPLQEWLEKNRFIKSVNSKYQVSPSPKLMTQVVSDTSVIWVQDFMQWLYSSKSQKSELLLLPYEKTGHNLARSIAEKKEVKVLDIPFSKRVGSNPGHGDFGGNLEAINEKLIVVGNNMSKTVTQFLKQKLDQEIVTLDTQWLEPGHVDELLSVVPTKTSCGYSVIYASPFKALSLLEKSKIQGNEVFSESDPVMDDHSDGEQRMDFSKCLKDYDWKNKKGDRLCQELYRANLRYDSIIESNISKIKAQLVKNKSCSDVEFVALPVLFAPTLVSPDYGKESDRAVALNTNSVNGVSIGDIYIKGLQKISSFRQYTQTQLKKMGLNVIEVKSSHLHILKGGIHCATNVERSRKSPKG
jgi:hypothetical protein